LGGLRSTCTYIGAACIEDMPGKTYFVAVWKKLNYINNLSINQ
jgi:hypothetical protein